MNIIGLENAGTLRKVKLNKQVNSHSSCEIEMILTDDNVNDLEKYIGFEIVVEDDGIRLMIGKISSITLKQSFSVSTIVFWADSFSTEADKTPFNRVFQDTQKKYSDIVSCIKNVSLPVQILEKGFAEEQEEHIIIQHNETDFEFVRRLSLSRGLNLFVDDTSQMCSLNIGRCFSGKKETISDKDIILSEYFLDRFEVRYIITSRKYFNFGSEVSLNGFDYLVIDFSLIYENGTKIYKYILSRSRSVEDMKTEPGNHSFILGKGKVVSNDDPEHLGRIQVTFLEYEDKLMDNKLWIPYINNMTEKDRGMMFIPDADETVNLYVCNSVCYASGCVRNKSYNSRMNDVSVRTLFTRNAEIDISNKRIGIDAFDYKIEIYDGNAVIKKGGMEISMNDDTISTKNSRSVISVGNANIKIGSNETDISGSSKVTIKTSVLDIG